MIDLKKYQDKEFLISGICLAIGVVLLISFYVSFSVYIDSETKAIDVNIKSFQIGNRIVSNTTVQTVVTETTPVTITTAAAITTTTVPETTEFSAVFTTSKTKKTTKKMAAATSNTYQRTTATTQRTAATVGTTIGRKTSTKAKKVTTTNKITKKKTTTTTTAYSAADEKQTKILKLVNQKRKQAGLKSVKPLISLDNVALIRAKEIAGNFSHLRPNGNGGETVLSDKKIEFSTYVENIGEGNETAEEIFNVWWNSPAGKANILNKKVKYIGTACYYYPSDPNKYFYYWVQIFYC